MKKIIVGASFPETIHNRQKTQFVINHPDIIAPPSKYNFFGIPGVLYVLPEGDNVVYCSTKEELYAINPDSVEQYVLSFWLIPDADVEEWMIKVGRDKIIAGGCLVDTNREYLLKYAGRLVIGPCDDLEMTLVQSGRIVNGITNYKKLPRYDLFPYNDLLTKFGIKKLSKHRHSVRGQGYGIQTSRGCYNNCDFCITTLGGHNSKFINKPLDYLKNETELMFNLYGKQPECYIYDSNFMQSDNWHANLAMFNEIGLAESYGIYGSANAFKNGDAKFMAEYNVDRIVIGLEDINKYYAKNSNIEWVCEELHKNDIDMLMTYIINVEDIIEEDSEYELFVRLYNRFMDLRPAEASINFLIILPGSALYRQYCNRADFDMQKYQDIFAGRDNNTYSIIKYFTNEKRALQLARRSEVFYKLVNNTLRGMRRNQC